MFGANTGVVTICVLKESKFFKSSFNSFNAFTRQAFHSNCSLLLVCYSVRICSLKEGWGTTCLV